MTTKQSATVYVKNCGKRRILSVSVAHRYSDDYTDQLDWGGSDFNGLSPNEQTAVGQTVRYHTGFLTTGRDWWHVTWVDEAGVVRVTDPNNFRSVFDVLEKAGKEALSTLGSIGAGAAMTGNIYGAALTVTKLIAGAMLNEGATSGFKQHILRGEDAGTKPNVIEIHDGKVVFRSPSGTSTCKSIKQLG